MDDVRPAAERPLANYRTGRPDYPRAMGIAVTRGRMCTKDDRTRRSIVISQRAARTLWPGEYPIGRLAPRRRALRGRRRGRGRPGRRSGERRRARCVRPVLDAPAAAGHARRANGDRSVRRWSPRSPRRSRQSTPRCRSTTSARWSACCRTPPPGAASSSRYRSGRSGETAARWSGGSTAWWRRRSSGGAPRLRCDWRSAPPRRSVLGMALGHGMGPLDALSPRDLHT